MGKKGKKQEEVVEVVDTYIGADPLDDDLMDMEYIQRDDTPVVNTHPPETKEEAEALAEEAAALAKEEPKDESDAEDADAGDDAAVEAEEPAAEEAEAETEAEAEEKEKKIPYDRFDTVNKQRKELAAENERLKAQLESKTEEATPEPEPEPYDYASQEKAAMDALLEGDQERYARIRNEIRAAEREETLREAQKLASLGDKQLQDNLTFEETGARLEQQYPELSTESETYNEEARTEMLDLYVGYAKSGLYSRTQALVKAAENAAKIYGLGVSAEEDPAPDNVVKLKQPDIKKKAKAAADQPPTMQSTAAREEIRRDINSMSDEEYESLPESTKRRMRGDIL